MRDLVETAERLRQVRKAQERFLALWAAECLMSRREALEKVAADVGQQGHDSSLSDPFNHDWSLLYKGSILDD